MAQARVFHARRTTEGRMYDPRHDGPWPFDDEHSTLTATVELPAGLSNDQARERAFEHTNNITQSWWHNEGVTIHVSFTAARSTSVGDIVALDSGVFRVEAAGWSYVEEQPWRLADSAFRGPAAPNITHATDATGDRTLCGRKCARWQRETPTLDGPDCNKCRPIWRKRRGLPPEA